MSLDDRRKAAFDYASDTTKQLITLATVVVGVSITFSKDIVGNTAAHRTYLVIAWFVYIGSIVFGVCALLALTGELQPTEGEDAAEPSIRGRNVTMPSILQIVTFLVATILLVVYGALTLKAKATTPQLTTTTTTG